MFEIFKKKNKKNKQNKDNNKDKEQQSPIDQEIQSNYTSNDAQSNKNSEAEQANETPFEAIDTIQKAAIPVAAHEPTSENIPNITVTPPTPTIPYEQAIKDESTNDTKLDQQLEKSRNGFGKKVKNLFSIKKTIDDELFEDIETTLLMADVGAKATLDIVDKTAKSVKRLKLGEAQAVYDALKTNLQELAATVEKPLIIDTTKKPFVILIVGVNGVGKTTTIAKIARKFKLEGKSVMLAAGDTFRAAAVEQLKTWGYREGIPVVAQTTGSDSASVIFDAMSSAKAKGVDILIADTAGRLHTQTNLMQELGKIGRVIKKNDETAPHETLIVVDGGTGQNAISQINEFNKTTKLTGIAITKLDGTAKGGVLFNLAKEFAIPVRYIGVGERASDLKTFVAKEFVDALLE